MGTTTMYGYAVVVGPALAAAMRLAPREAVNASAKAMEKATNKELKRTLGVDQRLSGMPRSPRIRPVVDPAMAVDRPIAVVRIRGPVHLIEFPRKGGYEIRPKRKRTSGRAISATEASLSLVFGYTEEAAAIAAGRASRPALKTPQGPRGGATGGRNNPPRPVSRTFQLAPTIIRVEAEKVVDATIRRTMGPQMPTENINLKITGDSRDAVNAIDQTTQASRRAQAQAERTQRSIRKMLQGISVTSAISALGNVQSAFQEIADIVNALTGAGGRKAKAAELIGTADTPAKLGAAAAAEANRLALDASIGKIWQNITPGTKAGETKVGRRVTELIKYLRGKDPNVAAVSLANVPEEFFAGASQGYTRADVAAALQASQSAAAFQTGLASAGGGTGGGGGTTNIIYPTGTNPTNVDRMMTRYQQVNGNPRRGRP